MRPCLELGATGPGLATTRSLTGREVAEGREAAAGFDLTVEFLLTPDPTPDDLDADAGFFCGFLGLGTPGAPLDLGAMAMQGRIESNRI